MFMMSDVKLGIVRLGRVAGKTKYTILDEENIGLVSTYTLEPRMLVDHDGNGAKIFAYAYKTRKVRTRSRKVQDILWEKCWGSIAPGYCVAHKNGITVDNRLENLQLKRKDETEEAPTPDRNSLYYHTIHMFLRNPVEEDFSEVGSSNLYDADGEFIDNLNERSSLYECHFLPCTTLEKEAREFSVCGHCQRIRYCGVFCQQADWNFHRKDCVPRRVRHRSASPER